MGLDLIKPVRTQQQPAMFKHKHKYGCIQLSIRSRPSVRMDSTSLQFWMGNKTRAGINAYCVIGRMVPARHGKHKHMDIFLEQTKTHDEARPAQSYA